MAINMPEIDELPRRTASQARGRWADLAHAVQSDGKVAITSHDRIEMVLLSADEYRRLAQAVATLRTQEQAALDRLTARFDATLAILQEPDAARKMADVFKAKGKARHKPTAGSSF